MINKYGDKDKVTYEQQAKIQQEIEAAIAYLFASEDEGLQQALALVRDEGLPQIQISSIQGKLLQLLATACHARKILEIGALAGYSGIWLARALPADGRLISLEINAKNAELIRRTFMHAGVADRTEVRVGNALALLPHLLDEAPFDLVFIDADKQPYPHYLDWALRLTQPGSIIVADNTIAGGAALCAKAERNERQQGLFEYNKRASSDPRLLSLALAIDNNFTDGFTISVVREAPSQTGVANADYA
ncbi:O-methyltransferase [Ktedonosporobacter rubrisoli]|uniref:O-methyltransferase n=1 Tax=Ktedonosporobacter rubrisoli TaxID=2509675 RepID=A0A4P6JQ23_KTERU|nr:O-methyltransferase [Ktedonosporobacter rubrisoli]QBD77202.1 O-methyltransferase [Ktedonosporobacter rubrisoli]